MTKHIIDHCDEYDESWHLESLLIELVSAAKELEPYLPEISKIIYYRDLLELDGHVLGLLIQFE